MNQLQLTLMSGFDICMVTMIAANILKEEKKPKLIKYLIMIPIVSALMGVNGVYAPNNTIGLLINTLLACSMLYILYKLPIIETTYVYFISLIVVTCIQVVIIAIINVIAGGIEKTFQFGLIAQSIGILCVGMIALFVPFDLLFRFIKNRNKVIKYIIANTYVIIIFLTVYWNIDIDGMLKNIMSIMFLSAMIAFVNGVLLNKGWKSKYEEQELNIYKTYIPVVEQLMDDIRARQHEFDNHIQALRMIEDQDNEITQLISSYTDDILEKNKWNVLIKFNNKIISGFIYSKKKEAEQRGIDFEVIIETYFFETKVNDYQLIEMVGILLNNAFEAVADLPIRHVVLKVSKEKDRDVLEVKNRHPYLKEETISNMFKKGISTKSSGKNSKRGYGLHNLQKIMNDNDGSIEVYNEELDDNYVVFRILLN